MAMTRKDYNAIAGAIDDVVDAVRLGSDGIARSIALSAIEDVVLGIADAMHDASGYDTNGNRRFDRERFIAATGIGG